MKMISWTTGSDVSRIFFHFNILTDSTGNNESLVEAQMLREDMQKLSKLVVRPRCPREWLGRDDLEGIRRLVSNNAVGHVDNRRVKNGKSLQNFAYTLKSDNCIGSTFKLAGFSVRENYV